MMKAMKVPLTSRDRAHIIIHQLYIYAGFKLTNTKCMQIIDQWKKILCSNIVNLREVFTTKAFSDNCKCVTL